MKNTEHIRALSTEIGERMRAKRHQSELPASIESQMYRLREIDEESPSIVPATDCQLQSTKREADLLVSEMRLGVGFGNPQRLLIDSRNAQGIHYSSPAPWIAAIILSLALWWMLAWSIWRLFSAI